MKNQQQIDKKFLFKQNKQLRLQLKQAKQLIKLHKEAVLRLSQPSQTTHSIITILSNLISSTQQTSKIDKLNEKILSLQSQQMVLQKIVQQTDNDEKQTYHILAQQYNKIKQDNDKLQGQLHKFYQKIGEVDYLSGLVTKYKQVITPTDQALAFKNQQEQLLQFIAMQKDTIRKLTQQKNKLLKINIHMKQSVQKHKDQVRNMTIILNSPELMNISMQNQNQYNMGMGIGANNNGSAGNNNNILDQLMDQEYHYGQNNDKNQSNPNLTSNRNNLSILQRSNTNNTSMLNMSSNRGLNTTMNFIKMQKRIIKQQQQDQLQQSQQQSQQQYQCEQINILFPDKVQKIKKDKQITKVPYLNMMKIRQIMAKRDNKLRKQVQAQAKHINPTDKIIKLQTELDITRKQLTSQTLKFRNMSQELKNALKFIEQLQYRNQLLLHSNQRLQANYRNVYKDYQITKIVALRVEKAMTNSQLEESYQAFQEINSNENFDDKLKYLEMGLKKVFGRKVMPNRSQSLGK